MAAKRATINELRGYCAEWQAKLGLLDWKIGVRWATKEDFSTEWAHHEAEATCTWQVEYHQAVIMLNRKLYSQPHASIVHELLHILNEGDKNPNSKYSPHYERGLNVVAELLVKGNC